MARILAAGSERELPQRIHVDNGTEFTSKALDPWAYWNQVEIDLSRPGKPTDNPFIEAFNATLRRGCLSQHWFLSFGRRSGHAPTLEGGLQQHATPQQLEEGPTDLRPALSELRPVLYVVGPRFADQAHMVRSALPHVRVEVLENVGHALFVDEPQRFNRLLEEFLGLFSEQ